MTFMDHLQIEATDDTLKVDFYAKTGVLALEGESYPENPSDFFAPCLIGSNNTFRRSRDH